MARTLGRSVARAGAAWSGRRAGRTGTGGSAAGGERAQRRQAKRQARDARRAQQVAERRAHIERRARVRSRQSALRRSAARFHARRVGAVLAAAPLALLSALLWPICRFLRIPAPQWGRRVYRHLVGAARTDRAHRDVDTHRQHQDAEAEAAQADREQLPALERPAEPVPVCDPVTAPSRGEIMTNPNAFDFRAAAEEMLKQAQSAEPGGMMSVLASFESLPETLGLIAETFAVVAGRCSEEMPLDPAVGDALIDVNKGLLAAVDSAGEVSRVFATAHENDIRRHVDPRPGEEAWDTTANQDHQG